MNWKTHMAVGVGVSTVLLNPTDIKTVAGGTVLALAGALMPDIDTEKSKGSQILRKITATAVIMGGLLYLVSRLSHKSLVDYVSKLDSSSELSMLMYRLVPALVIMVIALIIGKVSKHRGFTHSVLGMLAYSVPIYMVVGDIASWFVVGYMSHIVIDMLNKEKVQVLYPFKHGVCLGICSASGIVNGLMFIGFNVITVLKYANMLKIF